MKISTILGEINSLQHTLECGDEENGDNWEYLECTREEALTELVALTTKLIQSYNSELTS
jgi:hypothetical protein